MAKVLGLLPGALVAARNDVSANQFYRELRAVGLAARRSEVLELFKFAKGITSRSPEEPFRDITRAPTGQEITPWPTRKATGIRQQVTLLYRDRTTGRISQTYWATNNENAVTRELAMAQAVSAYSAHADEYDQDLIGAVHTGSYSNTPTSIGDDQSVEAL